ncbi:MAG: class I SAM-dependent methyltransferase [Candidatus Methylomirabilia bacterium]
MVPCQVCGTYDLHPRPTADTLGVIYSADEYCSFSFAERGSAWVLRARKLRDRREVERMLRHVETEREQVKVLDIGAGDGALLEMFESSGVPGSNLSGADLESHAVERLRSKGFNGILGRVEELELPAASFDLVTMIQVIEHVADPRKVMRSVNRALRRRGILVLETPKIASWDCRFFARKTWGGYHFPRHWTLWSLESNARTLRETGFEIVEISAPPAAVTWRWSVNHVLQDRGWPKLAADLLTMNNPLALGTFWVIDVLPSVLGWSANMRVVARRAS